MEGLIPFIYKTIKRRRTRMYYKCLSSGAAAAAATSDPRRRQAQTSPQSPPRKFASFREDYYRRHHRSLDHFADEKMFSSERFGGRRDVAVDKHVVRIGDLIISLFVN
ncbi:hypothetical protein ACMD2_01288 [Ananas comosus]|uniref:Uncharacterized protein n=1 Tax=Ananas comosus TaxID=4615 RepID=A0A199VAV1_ANACO|nr:hypothetical protein ACMD2_01288 [Ananas comosus]